MVSRPDACNPAFYRSKPRGRRAQSAFRHMPKCASEMGLEALGRVGLGGCAPRPRVEEPRYFSASNGAVRVHRTPKRPLCEPDLLDLASSASISYSAAAV